MNKELQNKIEEVIKKAHKDGTLEPMTNTGEKALIDFICTSIATLAQEEARKEYDSYRKIALLISSIFYYGNFKAETPNERELQSLLEKVNLWPTNEDLIVKRSNLSNLSNTTLQ